MTVLVRAPSPALASFVEWIAYYDMRRSPDWRELVLPTGTPLLVVNMAEEMARWRDVDARATARARRGAVLVGACAGPYVVGGAGIPVAALVSFRPGGSYPFFEPPGSAISEPAVELGALWGRDGAVLRERLLEAATPQEALSTLDAVLVTRAVRPLVADPAVAAAAAMLGRGTAVAEVADRVGWTYRTLLRRFSEQAGLTPKRFAQVRRLQRLIAGIRVGGGVDWARAAAEYGYYDQSHLINEFRALTGLTPGAYRPQPGCRNHHLPPRLSDSSNPASAPSAIMQEIPLAGTRIARALLAGLSTATGSVPGMSGNTHPQRSHEPAAAGATSMSPPLPGALGKGETGPGVLARLAVTVGDSGIVEVNTHELGQVIQRILTASIVLSNTPPSSPTADSRIGDAVGELDDAVGLIRSWAGRTQESDPSLDMVAARLTRAAYEVSRLAGTPGSPAGVALRDASYSLYRAQAAICEARSAL